MVYAVDILTEKKWSELPWPSKVHQFWLNFIGSLTGWAVGFYLYKRLLPQPAEASQVGLFEVLLLLIAVLGITGFLPYTVVGIAGAIDSLVKKAFKAIE